MFLYFYVPPFITALLFQDNTGHTQTTYGSPKLCSSSWDENIKYCYNRKAFEAV